MHLIKLLSSRIERDTILDETQGRQRYSVTCNMLLKTHTIHSTRASPWV